MAPADVVRVARESNHKKDILIHPVFLVSREDKTEYRVCPGYP